MANRSPTGSGPSTGAGATTPSHSTLLRRLGTSPADPLQNTASSQQWPEPEVGAVAFKLPLYWPNNPLVWFAQAKSIF